jgi:hypothetical protein
MEDHGREPRILPRGPSIDDATPEDWDQARKNLKASDAAKPNPAMRRHEADCRQCWARDCECQCATCLRARQSRETGVMVRASDPGEAYMDHAGALRNMEARRANAAKTVADFAQHFGVEPPNGFPDEGAPYVPPPEMPEEFDPWYVLPHEPLVPDQADTLHENNDARPGDSLVPGEGRKFDRKKPQWGLLEWAFIDEVVKVLTHGALKYEPDNWKKVKDADERYFDAALRHLIAYRQGERDDQESRLGHLAHAVCCLMFLDYFQRIRRAATPTGEGHRNPMFPRKETA